MSPTQRTLELLRCEGFVACVVEKWIPQARRRVDAFGFGDLLAIGPKSPDPVLDCFLPPLRRADSYKGLWLIQCTSGTNHAARVAKIRGIEAADKWCAQGGRIAVVSWTKCGARGKRKTWQPRWEELPGVRPVEQAAFSPPAAPAPGGRPEAGGQGVTCQGSTHAGSA